MRGQFRVQRTLQNRLGQLLQKTVLPGYLFHRRTPLQQLIDQLPIQSHSISSQLVEKIVYTIWFTPSPRSKKNDSNGNGKNDSNGNGKNNSNGNGKKNSNGKNNSKSNGKNNSKNNKSNGKNNSKSNGKSNGKNN